MSCTVEEELTAYLDGELSVVAQDPTSSTGAGVAMCACCRSTVDPISIPGASPPGHAGCPPATARGHLVFTFSARGRTNGRGRGPDAAGGGR